MTYPSVGASNSNFYHLPTGSYSDTSLNPLDLGGPICTYSPRPLTPPSTTATLNTDPYPFDFSQLAGSIEQGGEFGFALRPPSPVPNYSPAAGSNSIQGDHVIYYFEHVRKIQYIFAGNTFTNVTYSVSHVLSHFHVLANPFLEADCTRAQGRSF